MSFSCGVSGTMGVLSFVKVEKWMFGEWFGGGHVHLLIRCRGIYCLLVCATVLDIMTPELIAGTDKFLQAQVHKHLLS